MMYKALLFLGTLSLHLSAALAGYENFPKSPNLDLTPGVYCQNPDSRRYPEQIAYCNREVDREEKIRVIKEYNSKLGYHIDPGKRAQFKIDHLIPLCAGGDNSYKNLWPQHESVYKITDPIEPLACQRMAEGLLSQKEAVSLIMKAKLDLGRAQEVLRQLEGMKPQAATPNEPVPVQ